MREQAFKIRTLGDLVLMIIRLRYEEGLNDKVRNQITRAGQAYELLDAEGRPTAKYFALMNDEAEQLARELTGQSRLCVCGCGRRAKIGEYALKRCRFRAHVRRRAA